MEVMHVAPIENPVEAEIQTNLKAYQAENSTVVFFISRKALMTFPTSRSTLITFSLNFCQLLLGFEISGLVSEPGTLVAESSATIGAESLFIF